MLGTETRDRTPDVSVVIPTFRRPEQVTEAVRSALGESTRGMSVEVIVVDDSPEGSAREPIERMDDARVFYRHREEPTHGNPSRVRNDGASRARGRFVHFLDDDDRVAPGAYESALAVFARRPEVGVVFGRVEPFGDDPAIVAQESRGFRRAARRARLYERVGGPALVVANQLFGGVTLYVNSACIIRREHVTALHGYDENMRVVEDLEFYVRAIREYGCAFMDRAMVQYRTGAPSFTRTAMAKKQVATAYGRIYDKYRTAHGQAELMALKLIGRGVLRWL